jgi:1,4-dihydroxy-2-naphthoate octaprenyltransferase
MLKNWLTVLYTGNLPQGEKVDVVSKWLLATRAQVLSMTIIAALVGGLLAQPMNLRRWLLLAACVVGVTLAHCGNNMLNDYFDYKAGLDTPDYARVQYGPHPIVSGLMSERTLLTGVAVVMGLDALIGVSLAVVRGWPVLVFAGLGLLISVFYTAEPVRLKRIALGELSVFIVWGPLMTGGTYYVVTGTLPWWVWLACLPYSFIVTTVLMGKHIDKREADRAKGIHTIPVLIGEKPALALNMALMSAYYVTISALVLTGTLGIWVGLVVLAIPRLVRVLRIYREPRPAKPPENYPVWPLWYVAAAFYHNKLAGSLFVLGLFLNLLWPIYMAGR